MAGRVIWNALLPLQMMRKPEDTKVHQAYRAMWCSLRLALLAQLRQW
jgi:hypothetical protein